MLVEIKPNENLMPGVFRIVVVLGKDEEQSYTNNPFYFEMPSLHSRGIVPEREYLCPPIVEGGNLSARFVKGMFWGYCYTNGCPEEVNPTPIDAVKTQLLQMLDEKFKVFSDQRT